MRRRPGQILLLVVALGAVLATAGCGSKSSSTTTTTTTAAATTTTTAAATTTTATTTTTASAGTTTTATTTATSAGSLGSLASSCSKFANLGEAFSSAISGANGDLQKEAELLQQFADKTPSSIKPDFEVLASAFGKIADALKGVDLSSGKTPDAATLAKLSKLTTEFNTPAFTKASNDIQAWATAGCKG